MQPCLLTCAVLHTGSCGDRGLMPLLGYCKSRFDRSLDDTQIDIVVEYLCAQVPPILNRNDPGFGEIFEILDAL